MLNYPCIFHELPPVVLHTSPLYLWFICKPNDMCADKMMIRSILLTSLTERTPKKLLSAQRIPNCSIHTFERTHTHTQPRSVESKRAIDVFNFYSVPFYLHFSLLFCPIHVQSLRRASIWHPGSQNPVDKIHCHLLVIFFFFLHLYKVTNLLLFICDSVWYTASYCMVFGQALLSFFALEKRKCLHTRREP